MQETPGAAARRTHSDELDAWLRRLTGELPAGMALTAVGALGRREMVAGSDLDLVFLHTPAVTDEAAARAQSLWYSIWDSRLELDHSVRTPDQALEVAGQDLKAALGLLDLRHLAGDEQLVLDLRSRVRAQWVKQARTRLPELLVAAQERAERSGELAFLLEPDLKEARGGLRDGLVPRQVAAAQIVDLPGEAVSAARELLLDVRSALHHDALAQGRKPHDRLLLQDQDAVAAALGYAGADDLMAAVAGAARVTAFALDQTRRRVAAWLAPGRSGRLRRRRPRPLAPGLVTSDGEVLLAPDFDLVTAAGTALDLRAARAAADADLPLSEHSLARLAAAGHRPGQPWTETERNAFVALLGAGPGGVPVIETLDAYGLWERWMPDWPRVRSRPQRNAFHRFTVDRHLLETVGEAAAFTREVPRPDLLLLAALLHDLGKGWPGEDHTDAGVREVPPVARRMGLPPADVDTLTRLVRAHITLAELATTRDTADPAVARTLAALVGDRETLALLRWLTEADSRATGPAMWSSWKAGLVDALVRRTAATLDGVPLRPEPMLTPAQEAMLTAGGLAVAVDGPAVSVVVPDRAGMLAIVSAVLSLHRLDVRGLTARVRDGVGLIVADTEPRYGGEPPDPAVLRDDVRRAVEGLVDVHAQVADRTAAYPVPARARLAPARVVWDDLASGPDVVVQVRAADGPGLLSGVAGALHGCGLHVHQARCVTLGAEAIDAFYVTEAGGEPVAAARRPDIETAVLAALG